MSSHSTPHPTPQDGTTRAFWSAVVVIAAVALFVAGGGWKNLSPPRGEGTAVLGIPELHAPEGELNVPPVRFTWTPGTEDAIAQVIIHHANLERFWASAPLRNTDELVIPEDVWDGIGAGLPMFWRVRETVDGRPAGSSRYAEFLFNVDTRGYRAGEAPTSYEFIE